MTPSGQNERTESSHFGRRLLRPSPFARLARGCFVSGRAGSSSGAAGAQGRRPAGTSDDVAWDERPPEQAGPAGGASAPGAAAGARGQQAPPAAHPGASGGGAAGAAGTSGGGERGRRGRGGSDLRRGRVGAARLG
nr:translation initiation factor IF-2-like [Setaria viridis]